MKFVLSVFSTLFFSLFLSAQTDLSLAYYLPENVSYNPEIPTPQSVLGFIPGKWHVTHDKLVSYMKVLAAASPRISIENRGATFEDRPILLLTITSEKNHKNLEQIQAEHVQLTKGSVASQNLDQMPVVVYQGFSIHGNESSGSNAALVAAYHLAAAQGSEIETLLDQTIILFDPSLNPDGLQRFAHWSNMHKSKNTVTDPQDREYAEVWPGGRTNHYWFDMNRDWLPVQLPESQARIRTFHQWYPNILTDHHEMGTNSTFFFQPGIQSRTHPLTPRLNQELTKKIGNYHAKALDNLGSLYYTEENFDDFYYGKGSTFPDINGGIGILFEQGSSRGTAQESDNGILTFPFTIRNQFTAILSTLEAAKNMRKELLQYQMDFYQNAKKEATSGAYVFGNAKDAATTNHLAEILQRHKIDIYRLKQNTKIDGKEFRKEYSYIVPKKQRQSRLLQAMFEKRTTFKDSLFYDISAWSFPLAFNMDITEVQNTTAIGDLVTDIIHKKPKEFAMSTYAYLMEWHEYYTPAVLYQILSEDIRAKVGMKPFSIKGKDYEYGTILFPVQNQKLNPEEIYNLLQKMSSKYHVDITGVTTGLTKGIDLGSNQFRSLTLPKIALLTSVGITSYDAGEIWHLMDQRYNIPVTKLITETIHKKDLSRYTHIIMPNTNATDISANSIAALKQWVKQGGTLIGYRKAVPLLHQKGFLKIELREIENPAKNIAFDQRQDHRGAQLIGGAIFEVALDRSHPINFGYSKDKLAMFRNTTIFIKPDEQSFENPIQYTEKPLLSGYISKKNLDSLSGSIPFKHERLGKGRVIAFTDNTNFRAFWYGTNKLLMNAIFFDDEM